MKRALQIIIYLYCVGTVVYFVGNYVHRKKQVSLPVATVKLSKLPKEKATIKKLEPKKIALTNVEKKVFKGKFLLLLMMWDTTKGWR